MTRWPAACSSSVSALASSTIWRVAKLEVLGAHARVDIDLDLFQLARRRGIERRPAHEAEAGELRLVAEIDVLADREIGEQRLLLEHHADALAVGVGGVLNDDGLSADEDLARIRLVDAAQDLHQRRLAGAVLADEADHLVRA